MTVQPVLPGLVILLAAVAIGAFVVVRMVRSPAATWPVWIGRLALVGACALLLLRPGIPGGESETLATEVDVVFVVDTTASIVAEDWDGDEPRLDGVRADVEEIVAHYVGARYALVTFDADAVVRVPLTTDARALGTAMAVLRPEVTANSRGSSVGIAAPLLADTLRAAEELDPDRVRLVFYLGDGEQTAPVAVESFADSARWVDGGAVLGYGTPAGGRMLVTSLDDGPDEYITYQGQPALSVIDPENLRVIADDLGVDYQERSADAGLDLPDVPATTTVSDTSAESVIELTWLVALVVAGLLALELARATTLLLTAARAVARTPRREDS